MSALSPGFARRIGTAPLLFLGALVIAWLTSGCAQEPAADSKFEDRELAARLASRIQAWHEGSPDNGETLKLVYFHPAKSSPQDHYSDRITRMMNDINAFLQSEMGERHGFAGEMRFELSESKDIVFHTVEGQHPGPAYQYSSAGKIRAELEAALEGKVDFANDFVLVLSGLSRKREDGSYFFHAPYYGDGHSNQKRGLCWAADTEMLDISHLTREADQQEFRYEEHSGTFKRSLAEFNALYIGGIAHELGHGLSLPHNGEYWAQRETLGTALMGSGKLHLPAGPFYRKEGQFSHPGERAPARRAPPVHPQ